jgi:hypothetical protein
MHLTKYTRLNKSTHKIITSQFKAFSLREQTMFRNMQLLSTSVLPDDCPERLFGTRESPTNNISGHVFAKTYAPGAIDIQLSSHKLQNSPASIHTPKQPAKVIRPASQHPQSMKTLPKGDRLPTLPRM